jgi:hypothetical protein
MLEKIDSSLFNFETWNAGCLLELGLATRFNEITSREGIRLINQYAIGYCEGNKLPCRPKENTIAVMFYKDDYFWTHLTVTEFNLVFKLNI